MTLGEKIKKARKNLKLTQAQLCNDKITRNMLSSIERNKATPSLETTKFIANRLDIPVGYLFSEDDDLLYYEKQSRIERIKSAFLAKNYKKCIELINKIQGTDDELSYILAYSYFEIGKKYVLTGSLQSGLANLNLSLDNCKKCIYDTLRIESLIMLYSALASNLQAPLLELDAKQFEQNVDNGFDYELYKYIIQDGNYNHKDNIFARHIKAKEFIKERKYRDAISILTDIEREKTPENYNAYVIFGVYSDLENAYKQLYDFENAYRYASKKLSLIEAFKT